MKLTVIVTCLGNIYIKFGISKIFDVFCFFKSLMPIKAVFIQSKIQKKKNNIMNYINTSVFSVKKEKKLLTPNFWTVVYIVTKDIYFK